MFSASLVCLLEAGIGHLLQDNQKKRGEALHNILAHECLGAICERPVDAQESMGSTSMLVEGEIFIVAEQWCAGDINAPWKYNPHVPLHCSEVTQRGSCELCCRRRSSVSGLG